MRQRTQWVTQQPRAGIVAGGNERPRLCEEKQAHEPWISPSNLCGLPIKPNNVETREETVFKAPALDTFYAFKPLIIIKNI